MFLSTSVTSVKTKVHKSLKAFARTFKEAFSDAAYIDIVHFYNILDLPVE